MCFVDPVTAAAAAATGLKAGGQILEGVQSKQAADYNAAVAKNNATAELQKGAYETDLIRRKAEATLSSATTAFAKAGVDPASGSAAAVQGDSARQSEMDVLAQRYSTNLAANAQKASAKLAKLQGRQALASGLLKAGTTLLTSMPGSPPGKDGKFF